jgi:hypothetical protein
MGKYYHKKLALLPVVFWGLVIDRTSATLTTVYPHLGEAGEQAHRSAVWTKSGRKIMWLGQVCNQGAMRNAWIVPIAEERLTIHELYTGHPVILVIRFIAIACPVAAMRGLRRGRSKQKIFKLRSLIA